MLEDRSRKAGRPVDEAMTLELLKEYGPPDKVAATYDPHPYLIGPRLYPFFIRVLKIVLSVLTIVLRDHPGHSGSVRSRWPEPELAQSDRRGNGGRS